MWRSNTINHGRKLYKSLVTSFLFCDCETWTLLADSEKRIQAFKTKKTPHLLLGAQDQRLGAEQDQLPCGPTGTPSGNCREIETRMVRVCHTPRWPLRNHSSGHLGRWTTPWSAEEMLHGQRQRVDIPAHARSAHNGLLLKKMAEDQIRKQVRKTTRTASKLINTMVNEWASWVVFFIFFYSLEATSCELEWAFISKNSGEITDPTHAQGFLSRLLPFSNI